MSTSLLQQLQRLIAPMQRRIRFIVGRGVVTLIADITGVQIGQVALLAGELKSNVERFQNFGFTSVPLPGAEAIVLFAGGDRSHGIIIAVEDRTIRLRNLLPGESAQYNALAKVVCKVDGSIEMTGPVGTMKLAATGAFEYAGPLGSMTISAAGVMEADVLKVRLGNSTNELLTIMSDFMGAVISATTATAIGPQLLTNPQLALTKAKLDLLKV